MDFPCGRFQEGQPGSRVTSRIQLAVFLCLCEIISKLLRLFGTTVLFSSLLRSSPHEKTFRYRTFLCLKISTCNPITLHASSSNFHSKQMIIFHICASIKNFVLDDLSIYPEGKEDIPGPNIILKKYQVTVFQTLKNIPVDLILQTPYSERTRNYSHHISDLKT